MYGGIAILFLPLLFPKERASLMGYFQILFPGFVHEKNSATGLYLNHPQQTDYEKFALPVNRYWVMATSPTQSTSTASQNLWQPKQETELPPKHRRNTARTARISTSCVASSD